MQRPIIYLAIYADEKNKSSHRVIGMKIVQNQI